MPTILAWIAGPLPLLPSALSSPTVCAVAANGDSAIGKAAIVIRNFVVVIPRPRILTPRNGRLAHRLCPAMNDDLCTDRGDAIGYMRPSLAKKWCRAGGLETVFPAISRPCEQGEEQEMGWRMGNVAVNRYLGRREDPACLDP